MNAKLVEVARQQWDFWREDYNLTWESLPQQLKDGWLKAAAVAIHALMEPSEDMVSDLEWLIGEFYSLSYSVQSEFCVGLEECADMEKDRLRAEGIVNRVKTLAKVLEEQ